MSDDVVVNPQGDLVVIPPHTDGNVVGRGVIDLINEVSDRVDSIEGSGGVAGPQGPKGDTGADGPAGPTVYPAAGIAVSTGSAWGTSIDPARVPATDGSNMFIDANSASSVFFNWHKGGDTGAAGVNFCNGAQLVTAHVEGLTGNAHFNGTVTSGGVNLTEVIAELQARVAALETK